MILKKVTEYEEISKDDIGHKFFKELEEFAQNNPSLLSYSKSGKLKPRQYVGIIQTKSGVLEIYPKITGANKEDSKLVFLKMLKTLKNHPFKDIHLSDLEIKKLPLLEIFIRMFLVELKKVVQKGIKSDYISKTQNLKFLKGKLKISKHLTRNFIHKERFYVEYDEYLPDIEVNRILKSALVKLNKISKNMKNQKHLRELLFIFDNVSKYKRKDFKYVLNRNLSYYKNALLWAEVFLKNRSFSVFRGENKAFALLFDMNKLFENYVGDFFKKRCNNVKLQHKKYTLFENEKTFSLIPDIVINKKIIIDTKWKIIEKKDDISQSDLYQMYAYVTKYKIKRGYLLYPFTKNRTVYEFVTEICNGEEAKIKIIFFDLKKEKIIAF